MNVRFAATLINGLAEQAARTEGGMHSAVQAEGDKVFAKLKGLLETDLVLSLAMKDKYSGHLELKLLATHPQSPNWNEFDLRVQAKQGSSHPFGLTKNLATFQTHLPEVRKILLNELITYGTPLKALLKDVKTLMTDYVNERLKDKRDQTSYDYDAAKFLAKVMALLPPSPEEV